MRKASAYIDNRRATSPGAAFFLRRRLGGITRNPFATSRVLPAYVCAYSTDRGRAFHLPPGAAKTGIFDTCSHQSAQAREAAIAHTFTVRAIPKPHAHSRRHHEQAFRTNPSPGAPSFTSSGRISGSGIRAQRSQRSAALLLASDPRCAQPAQSRGLFGRRAGSAAPAEKRDQGIAGRTCHGSVRCRPRGLRKRAFDHLECGADGQSGSGHGGVDVGRAELCGREKNDPEPGGTGPAKRAPSRLGSGFRAATLRHAIAEACAALGPEVSRNCFGTD